MEPSLDLWIFAHRHALPNLVQRCMLCLRVQLAFMKVLMEKEGLQTLLRQRVSYQGIEMMLERICQVCAAHQDTSTDEGDKFVMQTLQRLAEE